MKEIAETMRDAVAHNFSVEGRPKWAPLAPSTIADKKRRGKWPSQILHDTGLLAGNITIHSDDRSATVGANREYAPIHQFGGPITIHAHSRQIRHKLEYKRKTKTWDLARQKGHPNLLVFARNNNKNARTTWVTIPEYIIHMPARPFFVLGEDDKEHIVEILKRYLSLTN